MNLGPSDLSLRVVFDDEDGLVIIDDVKNCDNILLRINEIKEKYYNNDNIKIMLTFTDDNKYYQIILSRNTNNKSI